MFLENAALLCIGLAAGALLSSPRRSISTLRTSVGSLERAFTETSRACADVVSSQLDHSRRIKWLEDARAAADQQCNEQVALLLGRLEGQELRLKAAEQAHSALAADMLQLGSEVNRRLDALEALERRVAELANQDALVETIDRQLRDMQQFIVEAAERAQQQAQPAAVAQPPQPAPPIQPLQPTRAPGVQGLGVNPAFQVTSSTSIDGILELQRQAQQAFMARRQPQPPVAGIEGAGL